MFRIQTFFAQNGKDNKPSITTSVTLSKYQPGSIKPKTQSQQGKKVIPYLRLEILKNHALSGDAYLPTLCLISLKHPFAYLLISGYLFRTRDNSNFNCDFP